MADILQGTKKEGLTEKGPATERHRLNRQTDDVNELLLRLAEGDQNAWGEMVLRFEKSVVALLTRMLQSSEEARDVAQDAFIYTWVNREKLREVRNLQAYFYKLAKFHAYTALRERNKKSEFADSLRHGAFDIEYSGQDIIITKETEDLLWLLLKAMPEQRRRVYEMNRFEGMSHEDIARELGITRGMVKQHIYRVNKELKETLLLVAVLFIKSQA